MEEGAANGWSLDLVDIIVFTTIIIRIYGGVRSVGWAVDSLLHLYLALHHSQHDILLHAAALDRAQAEIVQEVPIILQ